MLDTPHHPTSAPTHNNMNLHPKSNHFDYTILDYLPMFISVFVVDGHMQFRYAFSNRAALAPGNSKREDLLGKSNSELLAPADAIRLDQMIQTCVDRAGTIEQEYSYVTPNGTVWTETTCVALPDEHGRITHVLMIGRDITARKQRELMEQQRQAEIIEQQAVTLEAVSTPLLTISDSTVVMPLVGAIDTRRVQQIMDTLLSGVAESRARTVILDITGVPVVDTQVANSLLRSAQAVKLLGAQAILTGLRPEVAQTLVQLGVDLRAITTLGTLRDGIAYALQR